MLRAAVRGTQGVPRRRTGIAHRERAESRALALQHPINGRAIHLAGRHSGGLRCIQQHLAGLLGGNVHVVERFVRATGRVVDPQVSRAEQPRRAGAGSTLLGRADLRERRQWLLRLL